MLPFETPPTWRNLNLQPPESFREVSYNSTLRKYKRVSKRRGDSKRLRASLAKFQKVTKNANRKTIPKSPGDSPSMPGGCEVSETLKMLKQSQRVPGCPQTSQTCPRVYNSQRPSQHKRLQKVPSSLENFPNALGRPEGARTIPKTQTVLTSFGAPRTPQARK